ncbi:hypothetical protein ACJMK2_017976 [Sinanodonta woodiana]|uniref:Uncharacterized protein n=1 Tax=Sinanodonta woodiana TaxID=1069815 RepID=A0ABD3UDK9_SINWO
MSSSSSYPTEMVPISSDNSAAVETDSRIDGGYADINDTALPRKRRLPMPPALKPHRPKKNFTVCYQPCKKLCSYCVGSRLILSIPLLVLTLSALGAFVCLVTHRYGGEDPITSTTAMPTPTPIPVGIPEGSSGTLKFVMSPVQRPDVLNLLQESIGQKLTILQNIKLNFTNGTWSFDEREISIEISDKGEFRIVIDIKISNSQCRHAGTYFVQLSGNNHKSEQSLSYKVKAGCPCESEYELNSGKELKCELKVIGNTTISFNKVSGVNIKRILYQSGIHIPDNVPERQILCYVES